MPHAVRAASKLGKILRENGLTLVLVYLRERGSAESKRVAAANEDDE
jgi:hypothetical protein